MSMGDERQMRGDAARSVRREFGRRWRSPELAGQLHPGSVLELDSQADAGVDVYADGKLVAKGEPVVVRGRLCVKVQQKV
jgi:hypothetical protein